MERIITDKEEALKVVSKRGLKAMINWQNDKDVVMAAVQNSYRQLEHASEELQDDKDVVMAAVQRSGYALNDASERLQDDIDVVYTAITENAEAIKYASQRLKNIFGKDIDFSHLIFDDDDGIFFNNYTLGFLASLPEEKVDDYDILNYEEEYEEWEKSGKNYDFGEIIEYYMNKAKEYLAKHGLHFGMKDEINAYFKRIYDAQKPFENDEKEIDKLEKENLEKNEELKKLQILSELQARKEKLLKENERLDRQIKEYEEKLGIGENSNARTK